MKTSRFLLVLIGLLPGVAAAGDGEVAPAVSAEGAAIVEVERPALRAPRSRVADPWSTRGTVNVVGGVTGWSAAMPFLEGDGEREARADAEGATLGVDLYGRRLGFHLDLGGVVTESMRSEDIEDARLRYTSGEAHVAFTGVVWNSRGVFVGVGPGVEARASGVADAEGARLASWQSVVAGGDARTRIFFGPHVIVSGSVFAGVVPLAGEWQSLDVEDAETGTMEPFVLAASLAASLRPAEWIALSGGVSVRDATHRFEDASSGYERGVRPFVGLELLY